MMSYWKLQGHVQRCVAEIMEDETDTARGYDKKKRGTKRRI